MKKINIITEKGGTKTFEKGVTPGKKIKLTDELTLAEIRKLKKGEGKEP